MARAQAFLVCAPSCACEVNESLMPCTVQGSKISSAIISCFALRARAFRGVPSEAYGDVRLLVASSTDEGSGEAAERAQELALHTFNAPKVANSAIPLA